MRVISISCMLILAICMAPASFADKRDKDKAVGDQAIEESKKAIDNLDKGLQKGIDDLKDWNDGKKKKKSK